MKYFFAACTALLLLMACTKDRNPVLLKETTITVLHSTCVKTIVKVDMPNAGTGETWSDITKPLPVIYKQVFQAGEIKNIPTTGLTVLKQYKVKIYGNATGPQLVCDLLDAVNSPTVKYDIEFLP